MDDDQHMPMKPKGSDSGSKRRAIAAILGKLALHYPRQDLSPSQFKLVIDDMVNDLESLAMYQIERAANAWRTSGERFYPTSGQLLKTITESREQSIASARASQPAYRTPQIGNDNHKWPYELKPWRDILRDNGRPIPPDQSPMAQSLDALQKRPARADIEQVNYP